MVKRWRRLDAGSERLKVPQVSQGAEYRGSAVDLSLAGAVDALVLNVSLRQVRRDDPGRDTATVAVEVEGVCASVRGSFGVGQLIWADCLRWRIVVVEAAGLVKGDDEQHVVPLRRGADGVVDLLEEDFAGGDGAGRVHGVGVKAAARGVDEGVLWEFAEVGILEEALEGPDVGLVLTGGDRPVVELGVGVEGSVRAVVVQPADVLGAELLEEAQLGDG